MPVIGSLVSALPILRVSRIVAFCLLTRVRNATLGFAADHFDNNWHRSAVSRREALPLMRAELAELRGYDSKGHDGWRVDGVFYASIGDAFAAFFKAEAAACRRAGV